MELQNYLEEITRTLVDLGENNYIHMKRGMYTELGEIVDILKKRDAYGKQVDVRNLTEELGDFMWYFGNWINLFATYKITTVNHFENTLNRITDVGDINTFIDELYELVSLDEISSVIEPLCCLFVKFKKDYNIDFNVVLQSNVDKLKQRYPNKFDSEKALNRNIENELNAINIPQQ